ncbi:Uncharacterised protein [Klebsiella michiganensis]|uniref:Uncharacterized protein n=1 Tax=Klebsiella michiganensis TaxID=1134687 RepID=A0A7H4PJQ7_9ENTR|nr:Uncharacterised protein [Klebsiella michiganensis]
MEDKAKRSPGGKLALWGILCLLRLFPVGDGALLVGCRED